MKQGEKDIYIIFTITPLPGMRGSAQYPHGIGINDVPKGFPNDPLLPPPPLDEEFLLKPPPYPHLSNHSN